MKFGKLGVFTFTDGLDAKALAELARHVEALGYSTLWYPEALAYETFALGGYLLSHSQRLIVGSGIANIYARDPAAAAMGHNSLNVLYGGRFVLGLGVSHAPIVGLRGHDYARPVATMRAYLDGIEAAWKALNQTPAERHIVLAALGPQMTRLAGERTLGAFPYNVTPAQATLCRQLMPADKAVICEQKVCLTSDPVVARRVASANLGFYLKAPNYRNNWLRLGFTEADLDQGGSERILDAMVLWGDAATLQKKLRAYFEQGADQLVIQPLRPDGAPGPDWAALEALAGMA
ncbi:MAG: TIGR03620 family F420-dependent LLM class oxidoreductase [Gammaproteobacteria bacterium]|nr:TIGR03620 family F420-dependent LLM class oxidoreductase [Gammaproteobacteria bacterium]